MSEQDWEALHQEALDLGAASREWPGRPIRYRVKGQQCPSRTWPPDLRDRWNALACIAWVEDVAREVYGAMDGEVDGVNVVVCLGIHDGEASTGITIVSRYDGAMLHRVGGPTLPHAAISVVKAMKGNK